MSGQSLALFVFTVAIALAANRAEDISLSASAFAPQTAASSRGPASVSGKRIVMTEASQFQKHTAKVHGPVDAAVQLIGAGPNGAGDVFVLKGVVSASESVQNIEFAWHIPEGLEVVNGSMKSVISSLSPDRPYETQITLRQRGFDNARVHFKVRGSSDGLRFGDSAQYNSMMQEALEASRAQLKRSTAEDAALEKASASGKTVESVEKPEFKIFH